MNSGLPRQFVWWVFLLSLLFHPASVIAGGRPATDYVAVIDGGSSGSRIYLYDARRDENASKAKILMAFEGDAPGLSSFKTNPAEAGVKGLAPLLERLTDFLRSKSIPTTKVKVDVLTTAGMRLLDNHEQKAIFDHLEKFVQENGFIVGDIKTISGLMEGIYSWTDVNYLLDKFHGGQPTVGVIEVGGASAQIAFETTTPTAQSKTVVIGRKKHTVFVESFLGLGRNEARKHMLQTSEAGAAKNPCYPRGLVFDDNKAGMKGVSGDFNYSACVSIYEKILGRSDIQSIGRQLKNGPKSFAAVGAGNPVGTFWGLLDAWKIPSTNPFEIAEKAKVDCNKPWSDFEAQYGGETFNRTQCADSAFIVTFLYGDHELNIEKTAVTSYRSIHDATPTWTRGFVILEYLQ